MSNEYEFTAEQNETFTKLAKSMNFVGVFFLVAVGLQLTMALVSIVKDPSAIIGLIVPTVINVLLYGALGIWTRNAAKSMQQIVETEGDDISHLMIGIESLARLYSLQRALLIFALLIGVIGIGILMLFGPMIAESVMQMEAQQQMNVQP